MTDQIKTRKRKYQKRRRAELERETRGRITEAAVRLHGTIGPARTTVSAVALEAGVQRSTVYRHFPTEADLFAACSSHWRALNPAPDPADWRRIDDPGERLHSALGELYGWYEWAESMLLNVTRDAPLVPAMEKPVRARLALVEEMQTTLMSGRPERGRARRRVAAAVGLAVAFTTWHSLRRQGELSNEEVLALMAATVEEAAGLRC
jgi:AcrR family transcriptional regulator